MAKLLSLLITILFLSLGVLLGVLNPTSVPFDVFIYQLQLPLSVLLAFALVVGMLIGSLFILGQVVRLKLKLKSLQKQNNQLSNEVIELKKAHLTPDALKTQSSHLLEKKVEE